MRNSSGGGNALNLDDIFNRLKMLEDEMQNKLDRDEFDNEIASLRSMIGNID